MSDITQQAIMTLSQEIQRAALAAAGDASFVRFYDGRILRLESEGHYRVAVGNCDPVLPVYGNGAFRLGQHCYVVSPNNSKDFASMFILGVGGSDGEGNSEDHMILMNLVSDVRTKVDKADISQELGQDETKVLSQKAITDILRDNSTGAVTGIILGNTALQKDEVSRVTIPFATNSLSGVVKGSTNENQVAILADDTMEVNSIHIMRVNQHEDDIVILNGGGAKN